MIDRAPLGFLTQIADVPGLVVALLARVYILGLDQLRHDGMQ
jgi:hypothetical protein